MRLDAEEMYADGLIGIQAPFYTIRKLDTPVHTIATLLDSGNVGKGTESPFATATQMCPDEKWVIPPDWLHREIRPKTRCSRQGRRNGGHSPNSFGEWQGSYVGHRTFWVRSDGGWRRLHRLCTSKIVVGGVPVITEGNRNAKITRSSLAIIQGVSKIRHDCHCTMAQQNRDHVRRCRRNDCTPIDAA